MPRVADHLYVGKGGKGVWMGASRRARSFMRRRESGSAREAGGLRARSVQRGGEDLRPRKTIHAQKIHMLALIRWQVRTLWFAESCQL